MEGIIIIFAVLSFLILIAFILTKKNKYSKNNNDNIEKQNEEEEYSDDIDSNEYTINEITEQRLKYMESGNIKTKKIMNIEESKIFYSMVKIFENYNVNPQVSFRAFLKGEEDTDSWKTFRDFYCDFLITYKRGDKINEPIAVIEYDGAGHFGNTEEMKIRIKNNDLVKEKLISKAGMKYFIIKEEDIKTDANKFIDDKKLESCLSNIINSLKSNDQYIN